MLSPNTSLTNSRTTFRFSARVSSIAFTYWLLWSIRYPLLLFLFADDSKLHTLAFLGFGPLFLMLAAFKSFRDSNELCWPRRTKWILAYLAWMGISIVWTQSDSPVFAAAFYLAMMAEVAAGVILCRMKSGLQSAVVGIISGAGVLTVLLAIQLLRNPNAAAISHFADAGEADVNANYFGYIIAFGAIAVLSLVMNGKRRLLILLVPLTVALIATTSKTSIGAYAVIVLGYLIFGHAKPSVKLGMAVVMGFGGLVASPFIIGYLRAYFDHHAFESLTGRVPLWISAIDSIAQKPILGYGFHSFKDVVQSSWGAQHAHNDFLQQWVTLGLPGLIMTALLHFFLWKRLRRSTSPYAALGLMWLSFAVVRGLIESDPFYCGLPLQLMFLFFLPLPVRVIEKRAIRNRRMGSFAIPQAGNQLPLGQN